MSLNFKLCAWWEICWNQNVIGSSPVVPDDGEKRVHFDHVFNSNEYAEKSWKILKLDSHKIKIKLMQKHYQVFNSIVMMTYHGLFILICFEILFAFGSLRWNHWFFNILKVASYFMVRNFCGCQFSVLQSFRWN